MITQVMSNGMSTPPSYEQTTPKSAKKLIFSENSYPAINTIISVNLKPTTVELRHSQWFFVLLISVASIAIFNISTTFWIINSLHITNRGLGLGSFVLTKRGINIKNEATFDGSLQALFIKGLNGMHSLNFYADDYTNKMVLSDGQLQQNSITLNSDKLEIQTSNFQIKSPKEDNTLFNVQPNEITSYTQNFLSPSLGGYKIINSLETNYIRGTVSHDLRMESRTQRVNICAEHDTHFESKGGDIQVLSLDNIKLSAGDSIELNTQRLEVKQLNIHHDSHLHHQNAQNDYQLCVCHTGQLFAVPHNKVCSADADICQVKEI